MIRSKCKTDLLRSRCCQLRWSSSPATSSSTPGISQPLSTPFLPSTSTAKNDKSVSKINSTIPGGQELRGIAYLKQKPHVMAMEDDQYPAWLWELLDQKAATDSIDLNSLTKKQRIKYERKQEKLLQSLPKSIPIHEQSKDLPTDETSLQKRQEITKSSRTARRKEIRESNFLRGM